MAEYQNYEEIPKEDDWDRSKLEDRREQWMGRISRAEVSGMVDKWYEMDPELETLLYTGHELQEGMIVLIESPNRKVEVRGELSDEQLYRGHRWNRWFMISKIFQDSNGGVTFRAEYEDGTAAKLAVDVNEAWICKFPLGQVIGRATVTETEQGLDVQVTGKTHFFGPGVNVLDVVTNGGEPTEDARARVFNNGGGRSVFEETEERWQEEKGTPFPRSPFDTQESQTPGTTNPR